MGRVGTAGTWPLGDRLNAILSGLMPGHWQCRLGLCSVVCFPESGDVPPHRSNLLTPLVEEAGHLKGIPHLSPVLCRLPCKGTLHLAQISTIFLVKLWAVCEEPVAWKRRSGKSAVIPRQKWQPHVTGRLHCAAAQCFRTSTEARFLPGWTEPDGVSPSGLRARALPACKWMPLGTQGYIYS